ncbi:programmed cell death protein 6-like isoform X2 [Ptychodera flava]|uniref:programmed cell death protein 6-like isoform X2 n=1 Tax=Ptychodera flava TaxID=63121 RepID=UPI003969C0C9
MSWGGGNQPYAPQYQTGAPASAAYGQSYGTAAPPPQQAYGAPPQQGYRPPAPQQGYGAAPQQGYGTPPPQQGYGAPPPQHGYGAPTGHQYGAHPQQYGAPSQSQGYGATPPQSYAGYGGAAGYGGGYGSGPPPPPGVDPKLWDWFRIVDADGNGKITALELRQVLLNGNWSPFNAETCRLMIGMFDRNKDGTIDVHEFAALWKYIEEWKNCFDKFDLDRSGNIDAGELLNAFRTFGYQLSMDFCRLVVSRFDRRAVNTINFDDFIQCCVMLRSLTDSFKQKDVQRTGWVTVTYEEFLQMVLENSNYH